MTLMAPGSGRELAGPLDRVRRCGIVPVIVIDDARDAIPLAEALLAGGIECAEITLRTDAGLPALRALARHELLTGAGTVLEPDLAEACRDAGARFVVSPGYDPAVVERCHVLGLPVLPGIATASEALRARRDGLRAVKFFPAEQIGGLAAIMAMAAAIPDLVYLPTGGITAENAAAYLASPHVLAVGGSWLAPRALIAQGEWSEITSRCARAAQITASVPG